MGDCDDSGRCDDWCDDEGHDFCGDPTNPDDPARCMCEECSGCAECSPGGDEPPACIMDCIMALMPTEDALAGMPEAEAMAAYETAFQGFCACDSTACTAPELEEIKIADGPLCCNPDFYSGPPFQNALPYDCTGVPTMSFADFIGDQDDGDGHLASDCKCQDKGKGKGNFEVPNSHFPELFRAGSRLYRSQILEENMRLRALAEIYAMHSFALL